MEFQLTDDYLNTSDGNAMSVDDRIKNAFAVDGKVSYKGKQYDSEVELRKLLIKEGFVNNYNTSTDVIKKAASTLFGLILVVGLSTLLFACNGNSKSNVNVPTEYCEELVKLTEEGNAEAQYNMANLYFMGKGVEKNYEETARLTKLAAEQGNAKGMALLGYCYMKGFGVPQDMNNAIKWLEKATELENPTAESTTAESTLGTIYFFGINGVPQDIEKGLKYTKRAAEHGDPVGMYCMGLEYIIGQYVPMDKVKAFEYFKRAAEHDEHQYRAQFHLGLCYLNAVGTELDVEKGIYWLKKSAAQGYPDAIQELKRYSNF